MKIDEVIFINEVKASSGECEHTSLYFSDNAPLEASEV